MGEHGHVAWVSFGFKVLGLGVEFIIPNWGGTEFMIGWIALSKFTAMYFNLFKISCPQSI